MALQPCDAWFDCHIGYGVPGFHGPAAIHVAKRKNYCERKGHRPAVGRAIDPAIDILHQLRFWMTTHGLQVSRHCLACGADVRHFSGISARKGGITTAISARVTEEILFLPNGHHPEGRTTDGAGG